MNNWLRQADVEDGIKPGTTAAENEELKAAKRRIRLLEQEDEVLRHCCVGRKHEQIGSPSVADG